MTLLKPRSAVDTAYVCFAWIAVVPWIEPVGALLPIPANLGPMILTLVSVPVVLTTIAAAVASWVLSMREWREWPLVVMTLTTVGMFALFLAVDEWALMDRRSAFWGYAAGSAVLATLCLRRFATVSRAE